MGDSIIHPSGLFVAIRFLRRNPRGCPYRAEINEDQVPRTGIFLQLSAAYNEPSGVSHSVRNSLKWGRLSK